MRRKIIGFTGQMGAGKTEATNCLSTCIENLGYNAKVIKFAQPIYDIAEFCYDRIHKDYKGKDRKLMQFIGTDWGREVDQNLWVNIWELDVKHSKFFNSDYESPLFVLTDDVRFDNEAQKIIEMGGVVIKIDSTAESREKRIPLVGTSHKSESGVSDKYIHATVFNNDTIENFKLNLKYLLDNLLC